MLQTSRALKTPFLIRHVTPGLAICAALFLNCGCKTTPPISFGLFAVPKSELAEAKTVGVDFLVAGQDPAYLNEAARLKLKIIATGEPGTVHPSIAGFYLTDEPDLLGIEPDRIQREYERVKKRSKKTVFLNLSSAHSIEVYSKYCDAVMFDWYPVGWQPIETFFSHLRIARLASRE
jgi:hypothetical protein